VEHVGKGLGLDAGMAALGVVEMVDENMANAARVHAIESAKSYEGRAIIAFGGGGPVHGFHLARKLGIRRVIVPPEAGVASALGLLTAPPRVDRVATLGRRLLAWKAAELEAASPTAHREAETAKAHRG